jgi:hypothetical protein
MSRRTASCLTFLGLVAAVTLAAAGEPRVVVGPGGQLVVSRLPTLLAEPSIRRHLDSGLTTSLVLQGGPQGAPRSGAARIDVRFELWDELYLVVVVDGEGRVRRFTPGSFEELAEWWSQAELVLAADDPGSAAVGRQARVSLAVVPFSQAELLDTQRWLVESIGQGGAGSGRGGGATSAVSALIATSMQRRAVHTVVWTVTLERREER